MNIKRKLTALSLAGVILITPITSFAHHGNNHHNRRGHNRQRSHNKYYYCYGESAHRHNNGCPHYYTYNKNTIDHNKKIQRQLTNLGYRCGNIDGSLGPASKYAIKCFQKNHGLKVDGVPGNATLKALGL